MKKNYFTFLLLLTSICLFSQTINIPDAAFKAKLLEPINPGFPHFIKDLTGGNLHVDANNDGEIQESEALNVGHLDLNSSSQIASLEGIQFFTNINVLRCVNNQLQELNLNSLVNLQFLDCHSNQLNLLEINNCTNLVVLYCPQNALTFLNLSGLTNLEYLNCDYNSITELNVTGLTSLLQISCENNSISNLIVSGLPNLTSINCSGNSMTALEINNLPNLQALWCSNNQLSSMDINSITSLQLLYCPNNYLTTIDISSLSNLGSFDCSNNYLETMFIKNNYIFAASDFGNNNMLKYICADEGEINHIQYKINLYGYPNCHVNSYCSFSPGGTYYTINGGNKLDSNNDGCDSNDISLPYLKYSISDGTNNGSLITNYNSNFSIDVSAGNYTLTPFFENPNYFTASPSSISVNFPSQNSPYSQDFCIVANGEHNDLEVVLIPLSPARPGFNTMYKIKYKNKGTTTQSALLKLLFNDNLMDYVNTSTPTNSSTSGTLEWNINNIIPFQTGEIYVTFNINTPTETPAVNGGDILTFTTSLISSNIDEILEDNTFNLAQIVVNAFDPNDKTCLEGETLSLDKIGDYIHYMIRFENTGTYAAENIVIKDIIDTSKFDISSLRVIESSHNCETKITSNKVEFIFENINLPFEDATNDGYVVFKIKTNSSLVNNSSISNSANIYFDYNFPIVTNTATSTFSTLDINTIENTNVSFFPNPFTSNLSIIGEEIITSISIYDSLGRLLQTNLIEAKEANIKTDNLMEGTYLLQINTQKGIITKKIIKQ
jgi:Leucine-rich repeat (LRR) protein